MEAITIRNFRCFSERKDFALKPLTLLVGENSTGKSSFMAAIRIAWDIASGAKRIDFNEEPFLLGAFDQIAHFRGGRGGRAQTFELGSTLPLRLYQRRNATQQVFRFASHTRTSKSPPTYYSAAEFTRSGSHPVIQKQVLRSGKYELVVEIPIDNSPVRINFTDGQNTTTLNNEDDTFLFLRSSSDLPIDWRYILRLLARGRDERQVGHAHELDTEQMNAIKEIIMNSTMPFLGRPVAIAPVRTRPQRTYNPVSDTPLPEGEHIPMVLAKTFFEDKESWDKLKSSLDSFGSESGLFSNMIIKPLGRHESDPFQINVKLRGPFANLIDVGYGVSQVLPILVYSLLADRGSLYLLQQPEVHLHPRAQAALGSFLLRLTGVQSMKFVVETHSDHLIDRIRMDVRDKKIINPDDVSILYFDKQGVDTVIHALQIDVDGNLFDVPQGYRGFFLTEERRFLGE